MDYFLQDELTCVIALKQACLFGIGEDAEGLWLVTAPWLRQGS
jgi:hypothetical protein